MSIIVKNIDLVLKISDNSIDDIINKYDSYLEALCDDNYSFQRDAIKTTIRFLLSKKYKTIKDLAKENYKFNNTLQSRFPTEENYLAAFPLGVYKSCSLDLATGTGKSYLMFGIAQIMLAEKTIDKVLVLCPSLSIEEGLLDKFNTLNNNKDLLRILTELNPMFIQPEIKIASETIGPNDICIENIHATYLRTGSSIAASFKNEGQSVLVMNDEAHHIFSGEVDTKEKKWIEFLKDKSYNFKYLVNVTGTPYYGSDNNDYFNDVIYRFGLKQAVEKGIVKKVDPKTFDEYKDDKGYQQIWAVHEENIKSYGLYVKPITIIICANIVDAILEWNNVVMFLSEKSKMSFNEAAKKVLWVTSSIPGKETLGGSVLQPIFAKDEEQRTGGTIRKDNLALLKRVDYKDNPIEWIISVSMLTEGWDVKNVFQVVPHKQRAFNSKLLISQVLGRGLRLPDNLKKAIGADKIFLKVNNHEKWSHEIKNLYDEILELDNKLSWGYDPIRKQYLFSLHNLKYEPRESSIKSSKVKASMPKSFGFNPQRKLSEYKVEFLHNSIDYTFEEKNIINIDIAVVNLYTYLKEKDRSLVSKYSKKVLKELIQNELITKGYDPNFLSKENYLSAQQAFGPVFREKNKELARIENIPNSLYEISLEGFPKQTFSEDSLKRNGYLYYTNATINWYKEEQLNLFKSFTENKKLIDDLSNKLVEPDSDKVLIATKIAEIAQQQRDLEDHLNLIDENKFKTCLNALYVSYTPEIDFTKTLFLNIDLFDAFIKSPDKGFYGFPYSYKPLTKAKTHIKNEIFNPDFFLKLLNSEDIIVVEIKKKDDDSNKNKAKLRDGKTHFNTLNTKLEAAKFKERYYFKFLSDHSNDYANFFQSIKDGKYKKWKSNLMNQLEE